jgi:NAD-dependent SIR2 family protein deacetylase
MKPQICTHCHKTRPADEFIGPDGKRFKKCSHCREKQAESKSRMRMLLPDLFQAGKYIFFKANQ